MSIQAKLQNDKGQIIIDKYRVTAHTKFTILPLFLYQHAEFEIDKTILTRLNND